MKNKEIWKDVEGYEGKYQVSSFGRVKSLYKEVPLPNGGFRIQPESIMRISNNYAGYKVVGLTKDRKSTQFRLHRLVAITFLDNPENKPHINHIDADKSNNCISNLEWVTPKQNTDHAIENGLRDSVGEANIKAKLTEVQVIAIRDGYKGMTQREVGKIFGVSDVTVSYIRGGKAWTHLTN